MTAHHNPNHTFLSIKSELEQAIRARLNPTAQYSLVSRLNTQETQAFNDNMEKFLQHKLTEFIEQCGKVLPVLTREDVMTIGSAAPSAMALEFLGLFTLLEQHGIHGPAYFKLPVNFWSGESASAKAYDAANELSDNETPSMSVMHMLVKCLQVARGCYDDYILLLSMAISRVFSTHAMGVANVYIASEKSNERAGLTVSNNFWEGELSSLLNRYHRGELIDIRLHFYDDVTKSWQSPVSYFSPASHFIRIRRRNSHHLDEADQVRLFKTQSMSSAERLQWKAAPPRPAVSLGKIRQIVSIWRSKTAYSKPKIDTNKLAL